MKTIWRQTIDIVDEQTITAPWLGRILAVDSSRPYGPEVWFEVDTEKALLRTTLWVVGTGNPIPDECVMHGDYVGHFISMQGRFVGHVYASRITHEVTA